MKKHTIFFTAGILTACAAGFALPKLVPEFHSLLVSAAAQEVSENTTLEADMVVDGDLILSGGTLNLNGHTLTVKGDLWHKAGILQVSNGSTLHITGDYNNRAPGASDGKGELQMEKEPDGKKNLMDVDGSVHISTYEKNSTWQDHGTLQIGGDLDVWAPYSNVNGKGLAMDAGTVVIFKGDKTHEVYFDRNDVNYITNIAVTDGGSLHLTGQTPGFKLASDLTLAADSTVTGSTALVLNGYTLTTEGDFTQDGELRVTLNGSKMNVNGDYWHKNGILEIEHGSTLHITGDYNNRVSASSAGKGELQFEYEDEGEKNLMDVDGSVHISTFEKESTWQDHGTLQIGGDLDVWAPFSNVNGKGLAMDEGTVVIFKGDKTHEVYFEKSGVSYISNIAMTGKGSLHLTGQTPGFKLASDMKFADGSTVTGKTELKLNGHTLWVDGSFNQDGELTVNLADSNMIVKKDYWHKAGILYLNNSALTIGRNYEIRSSAASSGSGELRMERTENNRIAVNGDVNISTFEKNSTWQDYGTLQIGGNLNVWSPFSNANGNGLNMDPATRTAFRGGKKHTVYFEKTVSHTGGIQLDVGDSIEFTAVLNGVDRTADSRITVEPADLAAVDQFTVTGVKTGEGTITFTDGKTSVTKKLYVVAAESLPDAVIPETPPETSATVTDDTAPGSSSSSTTTTTTATVTEPEIPIRSAFERIAGYTHNGGQNLNGLPNGDGPAYAVYKNIDFDTGARSVRIEARSTGNRYFEIRLDSLDGTLIGTVNVTETYKPTDEKMVYAFFDADVTLTEGIHDVYLTWCPHPSDYTLGLRGFVFGREDTSAGPPVGSKKGDVNEDGSVDLKDVTILRRHLAGGWNVRINEYNSDVNGDGSIDLKDVTILRRYLAGGWGIEL